ncbi:MAG: universal stress protein [Chloroflexi bacterium]|nr:universal stress protein [Chloroflexota bacterium]MDA8189020.1 universal stress protein [Dehalococcoidales bacterium]
MSNIFECLLVPVNGSKASVAAVNLAIQLAKEHSARLVLIHVVDTTVRDQLARRSGRARDVVQRELEESGKRCLNYAAQLAERAGTDFDKVLRVGLTDAEIINEAEAREVSLIVIGRPVYRWPQGEFFGRVARHIIESAQCPVLVARTKAD